MADQFGDRRAASHFGLTIRSVQRYRARARGGDDQLSQAVADKRAELNAAAGDWAVAAVAFMTAAIAKLSKLVEKAEVGQMRDVVGAIKVVGELDITRQAMTNDELTGGAGEGEEAEEAEGGDERPATARSSATVN